MKTTYNVSSNEYVVALEEKCAKIKDLETEKENQEEKLNSLTKQICKVTVNFDKI